MQSADHGGGELFDGEGQRKYLCESEGRRFLHAASKADEPTRLFCLLLSYTGCRISEALELTPGRLDMEGGCIVFRTLKRRKIVFRAVPVPVSLLRDFKCLVQAKATEERLWLWSRQTAWRRVKQVMSDAGICGPQAAPRGLRHQFGVRALQSNVPLGLTQRMLGHASARTTSIYQDLTTQDARRLLQRMWYARPAA